MATMISNFDTVWIINHYKNIFRNRSKMIWFSTADIRLLLEYLERNNRSGVRIYRGKYPNHQNFSRVNGAYDYRNEKTMVIVPTILTNGEHEDEISKSEILEILEQIRNGEFPAPLAFNHGELCPPNCGGDTIERNT